MTDERLECTLLAQKFKSVLWYTMEPFVFINNIGHCIVLDLDMTWEWVRNY